MYSAKEGCQLTQNDGDAPPLLDSTVLDRLTAELDGDEGIWRVFVQDFVALLPDRIEKLRLAMTTGDTGGAVAAVQSLKTSSQTVGAERLAGLALDLERLIRVEARGADPADVLPLLATPHLKQLKQSALQTTYFLGRHLQKPSATA
jgi:HPt (histidine-containing phosphotransfer) domain-containing protein